MLGNGNECGKNQDKGNHKAAIPRSDYDTLKTDGECGIFQLLEWHDDKLCNEYT